MPTYEYVCQKCHHHFEQFQSMRDEPLKKCPKCKKAALRRLVGTGAGLIFKGTGFYITDYKHKGMKKDAAAESKPAESKSGESKSGEAKPAQSKPTESKSSESKSSSGNAKSGGKHSPKH